jgi:hypothetical protein
MTKPKHNVKFRDLPEGITKSKVGHYEVRMRLDGVQKHLGTFDTLDEAIEFHTEADNARVIRAKYNADEAAWAYDRKYLGRRPTDIL